MSSPQAPAFPCEPVALSYFDQAPVRHRFQVELPVTPARLFEVFEDPESWPRWVPGIGRVIWTSPRPFGPGTTRTVQFWGGMEVYEVFSRWEAGREMSFYFTGTSEEVWRAFGEHYRVEDLGGGRCRLTWRVAFTPAGTFGRIYPLVGWMMRLALSTYMRLLRRYCARLPAAAIAADPANA